jgi:hypothetical protein
MMEYKVDISVHFLHINYEDGQTVWVKNTFGGCTLGFKGFTYVMYEWLRNNCSNDWKLYTRYDRAKEQHKISGWGDTKTDLYLTDVYNGVGFANKEDAMAFKLKWL